MFDSLDINASALLAERTRIDTISGNVANMYTTHDADGKPNPYRRRFAVFCAGTVGEDGTARAGVHVEKVESDPAPFRAAFDPGNPDADKDGNVWYPNIDLAAEQANIMEASRAYEANVTMMETSKAMIASALRLIA